MYLEMSGNLSFRDEKAAVGDTLVSSEEINEGGGFMCVTERETGLRFKTFRKGCKKALVLEMNRVTIWELKPHSKTYYTQEIKVEN